MIIWNMSSFCRITLSICKTKTDLKMLQKCKKLLCFFKLPPENNNCAAWTAQCLFGICLCSAEYPFNLYFEVCLRIANPGGYSAKRRHIPNEHCTVRQCNNCFLVAFCGNTTSVCLPSGLNLSTFVAFLSLSSFCRSQGLFCKTKTCSK